jgi:hypothetical protein
MRSLATACAVVLAAAAPAEAGPRKVLVFPLTGQVPNDPGDGLQRFTKVVARAAGLTGADVTIGGASFDDTAALAGCGSLDAECLKLVAASLSVDSVVAGDVQPGGGRVKVILTAYLDGTVVAKTYDLAAGEPDAMVQELAQEVTSLFVGAKERPSEERRPEVRERVVVVPAPAVRDDGWSFGNVGASAWLVTGGGLALAAGGAIFLKVGADRQDQVNHAPTDSVADLEELERLEEEGARFMLVGNALVIAAGAAVVTGTILIAVQGRAKKQAGRRAAITPFLLRGGAGVALEVTLP